jgi:hypothetical protein
LAAVGLAGCNGNSRETPDVSGVPVTLRYTSYVDAMADISPGELADVFRREEVVRDFIFQRSAYPDDSVFLKALHARFANPHIDTLHQEIGRVFGEEQDIREQFTEAFRRIKYYYPDFREPRVVSVMSGLETDLYVSDSLIVVGLDYYLGPGAKYRPRDTYEYILRRYKPESIVPSCVLIYGIGAPINQVDPSDATVLAEMIAYGKAYYFASQVLPGVPDSTLIGYTPKEMEGSAANADLIWKRLMDDQVLFATDQETRRKYVEERPKTFEVGPECPGRIATWVGWQIVKAYVKRNPDITLPALMAMTDANRIFRESRYRP